MVLENNLDWGMLVRNVCASRFMFTTRVRTIYHQRINIYREAKKKAAKKFEYLDGYLLDLENIWGG